MLTEQQYWTRRGKLEAAVTRAQLEIDRLQDERIKADEVYDKAYDELEKFLDEN